MRERLQNCEHHHPGRAPNSVTRNQYGVIKYCCVVVTVELTSLKSLKVKPQNDHRMMPSVGAGALIVTTLQGLPSAVPEVKFIVPKTTPRVVELMLHVSGVCKR